MSEIAYIRQQIREAERIIQLNKTVIERNPDSRAYQMSLRSLQSKVDLMQQELASVSANRIEEVAIHFEGLMTSEHTIPIGILSKTLVSVQNCVRSIAESFPGINKRAAIDYSRLSVAAFEIGSFVVKLKCPTNPDLFGDSTIVKTLETFFDVLDAKNDCDKLMTTFSALGPTSLKKYHELVKRVMHDELAIEMTWNNLDNTERKWEPSYNTLTQTSALLNNIVKEEVEYVNLRGTLVGASILSNHFEVVGIDDNLYKGFLSEETKPLIRTFFDTNCNIQLQKNIVTNTLSGAQKITYHLLNLTH